VIYYNLDFLESLEVNMDDQPKPDNVQQIHINTADEMSRGRYSNGMMVSHSADEFMLDWLLNSPNGSHLVSRLIVSPAHLKSIVNALKENLDNYEKQFGCVREINLGDSKFH
jgi:hypothetical protein